MIANAHGQHWHLMDLRHKFPQSLKGTNLKQLIDHSLVLGFNARPVRLELEELQQLRMPCILHWDLNHFVVLQKISGNKITLLDEGAPVKACAVLSGIIINISILALNLVDMNNHRVLSGRIVTDRIV